jgi:hypothetical protein
MSRILFPLLLLIYGWLHLLGFGPVSRQLTAAQPGPLTGAGWLLAGGLFVVAAVCCWLKKRWWWLPAAAALLVSQTLIFLHWPAAKAGTLVNIILLAALLPATGIWLFRVLVERERREFLASPLPAENAVTAESLQALPEAVQKWLVRSNLMGREAIGTVYLKQKGLMRTTPAGKWWPVAAEQHYTIGQPGFFWVAQVQVAPFIELAGRDKYQDGHGFMLIKLLGLFAVVDARGPDTDQGTLLRYLAELVWFPSAALQPYISWQAAGPDAARATMTYGGISATGLFRFNAAGDVVSFEARRSYARKTGATLETWFIGVDEAGYREFDGIRVPAKAAVTWKLNTGDFTWFTLDITELRYNTF